MRHAVDWFHETELAAYPTSAGRARAFVSEHLLDHDLVELVDDVRLVTSELATNAMTHARTPFTVTLQGHDQSVLLTVRDGSAVLPIERAAQGEHADAGRGLWIVDVLSREWGVVSGNGAAKSVWARFDRCAEEDPAHLTAAIAGNTARLNGSHLAP
jgi:anti-sigma regulatory factor (Ser/Thr protein kinase)